jgi:NitT/TauT family transport system permease protein
MKSPLKNLLLPWTPISNRRWQLLLVLQSGLLLGLWASSSNKVLPGPADVAQAWLNLVAQQGLLLEWWASAKLLLLALAGSAGLSLLLTLAATAPLFAPAAHLVSVLRFLGFAGLTYVFMLLTANGHQLKLAMLMFGMGVMLVTSMLAEVRAIDRAAIDHCRTLGMRDWRITWELVLLGRADVFLDLIRQNAAIGWTLLTMVEGLSRAEGGLGALLLNQNRYFQLSGVFAIQLTILAWGLVQDYAFAQLKHWLCPWARLGKTGAIS